jgi:hypothetical protein
MAIAAPGAGCGTTAAVEHVGLQLDARAPTGDLGFGASGLTNAALAHLVPGTCFVAAAAVIRVVRQVDANAVAVAEMRWAGAAALHTASAAGTAIRTGATMIEIGLEIDTGPVAVALPRGTVVAALSRTADLFGRTGCAARPAVAGIIPQGYAAIRAQLERRRTSTVPLRALLARGAGGGTAAAMVFVRGQVYAPAVAVGKAGVARGLAAAE